MPYNYSCQSQKTAGGAVGFGQELQHLLLLCAPVLLSWELTSSSLALQIDVQQISAEVGFQGTGEKESQPSSQLLVWQVETAR